MPDNLQILSIEANNLIKRPMLRLLWLFSPISKRDNRHNGFLIWYAEKRTQFISIPHSHNQSVKSHCAGFQHEIGVTQAIVVSAPPVSDFIGLFSLEESGL